MIEEDGLRGMTSNPSIFEKAIADSHDYDEDIRASALTGDGAEAIYEILSQRDVQSAADEFRSLYNKTDGEDGQSPLGARHPGDNRRSAPVMGCAGATQRLYQGSRDS
jgi:transaldolase